MRLETAEERTIIAPPGHVFRGDPVYVAAGEVALRVADEVSRNDRTIFKISLID